ncbi:MAG TPA: hypothetical protein VEQ41_08875 [Solirubrobacterales bacterium]|nr:hypothetical protein [Solirubrobacterales bacterium]
MGHPGHDHGWDGRLPGQPDFERVGNEVRRYHPATESYTIKRPDMPPQVMHVDPGEEFVSEQIGSNLELPNQVDPPVCANAGHRVVAVFSYDPNEGPRGSFQETHSEIRSVMGKINWKIMQQSELSGGPTLQLKTECDAGGAVKVYDTATASEDYFAIHNNAMALFKNASGQLPKGKDAIKVLVFRDENGGGKGAATWYPDITKSASDRSDPFSNDNRVFTSAGVIWDGSFPEDFWNSYGAMHELFHLFGTTIPSFSGWELPPFASGSGHCNDGIDVMCYDDVVGANFYTETRCPASQGFETPSGVALDCKFDTYFDARPEPGVDLSDRGEWLHRYWNTGGWENPYLTAGNVGRWFTTTQDLVTRIEDMECASATSCVAVGSYRYGAEESRELALRWDGERWSRDSLPAGNLAGVRLNSVSCPSASFCVAVGARGGGVARVLSWNGSSWTPMAIPGNGGEQNELFGISCASSSECSAVGMRKNFSTSVRTPLAIWWNGSTWTADPPGMAEGAKEAWLFDVVCRPGGGQTECTAVGGQKDNAGVTKTFTKTRVSAWGFWVLTSAPNPTGATLSELTDVACPSASRCFGAGSYLDGGGVRRALVVSLLSGVAVQPLPGGSLSGTISGISCPSSSACHAVGDFVDSTGQAPRTLLWNGSAWSEQQPAPIEGDVDVPTALSALSCVSAAHCNAVASADFSSGANPATYDYSEGTWEIARVDLAESSFADISCLAVNECVAVGDVESPGGGGTGGDASVARHWDGGKWWPMPAMPGVPDLSLTGVACASLNSCTAVGTKEGGAAPVVNRWNGSQWVAQAAATPAGGDEVNPLDVSCPSPTFCMAVGSYRNASNQRLPLVQIWNGANWSSASPGSPSTGADSRLAGVSCASSTACVAVGTYSDASGTHALIERWDGSSWTVDAAPGSTVGESVRLNAVSCTGPSACTAVGSTGKTEQEAKPWAIQWTGSNWFSQWVLFPENASAAVLSGVSCSTASDCIAVGSASYQSSGRTEPLAMTWNGWWWAGQLPQGYPEADSNVLNDVSCAATAECVATGNTSGSFQPSGGGRQALAALYG